jgi:hypothetical protein
MVGTMLFRPQECIEAFYERMDVSIVKHIADETWAPKVRTSQS